MTLTTTDITILPSIPSEVVLLPSRVAPCECGSIHSRVWIGGFDGDNGCYHGDCMICGKKLRASYPESADPSRTWARLIPHHTCLSYECRQSHIDDLTLPTLKADGRKIYTSLGTDGWHCYRCHSITYSYLGAGRCQYADCEASPANPAHPFHDIHFNA